MNLLKVFLYIEVGIVLVLADCNVPSWLETLNEFKRGVDQFLAVPEPERSTDELLKLCSYSVRVGGVYDASSTCDSPEDEETLYNKMSSATVHLDEACERACTNYKYVRECAREVPSINTDSLCGRYKLILNTCVPRQLNNITCPFRDTLFHATISTNSTEALYAASCVPRPVLSVPGSNLSTSLPPRENTTQREDYLVTTGRDVTMTSTAPGPVCDVLAARACVGERQFQVDRAATEGAASLVTLCLAMGEEDRVTQCFRNNTDGCLEDDFQFLLLKEMWNEVTASAHTLCRYTCGDYKQVFHCARSLREEPLSQLCETRKAAIRCVPCRLAADMLHVIIRSKVPLEHLQICETEAPCPDLLPALVILEKCARINYWGGLDDDSCNMTWSVEKCLRERGLYSLQCRNLSRPIRVVLAGYEESQTICTTTTSTTTSTTTTTTTTTLPTTTTTTTTIATTTKATTTASTTVPRTSTFPITTPTTTTTTIDYQELQEVIDHQCDVDGSVRNQNLTNIIQATTSNASDAESLLPTNLKVCLKLLAFVDCLLELPDCKDSNWQHCLTTLSPELSFMVEHKAWCGRAVRAAATDMQTLQQGGMSAETGSSYRMADWANSTNITCTDGSSSGLFINNFLLLGFGTAAILLMAW